MDHYAYVNNSPVNYTDPSGHCVPDEDAGTCSLPQNEPDVPLTSDEGGGTKPCVHKECDGLSMYRLYLYYFSHPGGAWNANGGVFTAADFLAWIVQAEAGGDVDLVPWIMQVFSRQLWGDGIGADGKVSHKAYCPSSPCVNGVFNLIGAYSESAKRRYNALIAGNYEGVEAEPTNLEKLVNAGYTISSIGNDVVINPKWTTYNNDVPVHVGNYTWSSPAWATNMCPNTIQGVFDMTGIVYKSPIGESGYGVVVYTLNQQNYWSIHRSGMC